MNPRISDLTEPIVVNINLGCTMVDLACVLTAAELFGAHTPAYTASAIQHHAVNAERGKVLRAGQAAQAAPDDHNRVLSNVLSRFFHTPSFGPESCPTRILTDSGHSTSDCRMVRTLRRTIC